MIAYFECSHSGCVAYRDNGMLTGCAVKSVEECKELKLKE